MSKSIEFPGTAGNRYDYSINANQDLTVGMTMLAVVRVLAGAATWLSIVESQDSGGGTRPSIGRHGVSDSLYFSDSAILREFATIDLLAADSWQLIAATRPGGAAQTIRGHRIIFSGGTTHVNSGTTGNDQVAYATGKFMIAGDDDPANIRVAAWAIWDGTALSDGDIDGIASALTTQSILDLSPTSCFDSENDLMLTDLAGTLPGTLVGSITESSDGPTDWVYFGAPADTGLAWIQA